MAQPNMDYVDTATLLYPEFEAREIVRSIFYAVHYYNRKINRGKQRKDNIRYKERDRRKGRTRSFWLEGNKQREYKAKKMSVFREDADILSGRVAVPEYDLSAQGWL